MEFIQRPRTVSGVRMDGVEISPECNTDIAYTVTYIFLGSRYNACLYRKEKFEMSAPS
jgi:hypothetical protein